MKHINHNEIPPKQTIKRRRITTMIITYVNYYERELSSLQSFFLSPKFKKDVILFNDHYIINKSISINIYNNTKPITHDDNNKIPPKKIISQNRS
jgi:hypothetical protein